MELVCACLGDVVHNRAAVASVFGAVVGNDLYLFDRILVAEEYVGAADVRVVVGLSIQLEVVVAITGSVRRELGSVGVGEEISTRRCNTGREKRDYIEAISDRQICCLLR